MVLNLVYINKGFYIFNQVKFRPIYSLLSLSHICFHIIQFYYLVNILTFIKSIWFYSINKTNIYIKEKFLLHLAGFLSLVLLKIFKNGLLKNLISLKNYI